MIDKWRNSIHKEQNPNPLPLHLLQANFSPVQKSTPGEERKKESGPIQVKLGGQGQ
jgi:hypothetical protein